MTERSEGPSSKPSSCRSWSNNFLGRLKHKVEKFNAKVEKFNKKVDKLVCEHYNGLLFPAGVPHAVPVPTPPATTTTNYAARCAEQQGRHWTTPAGLHEASGSNPTSKQNSEYFDAVDHAEYTAQHQIPALHVRPSFLQTDTESSMSGSMYTQLAGSFDDMLLGSPTSHDRAQPLDSEPFPIMSIVNDDDPVGNELFFSSELFPDATSTEQHPGQQHPLQNWQVTDDASHATASQQRGYGSMSIMTGNTVESTMDSMMGTSTSHDDPNHLRSCAQPFSEPFLLSVNSPVNGPVNRYFSGELVSDAMTEKHHQSWQATDDATTSIQQDGHSMMDAGASTSAYVRSPVPTEPPTSMTTPFYNYYVGFRCIFNGDEVSGGSGRRGRGVRVAARIVCIAKRLMVKKMRLKGKSVRLLKRTYESGHRRGQCMKRIRADRGDTESTSAAVPRGAYKGVTQRYGKWIFEVRVSQTKDVKVWMTLESEKEAALAYDACLHHCSEKTKKKHFSELVQYLGPSQYPQVLALCQDGHKEAAKALVRGLAKDHAAAFGSSSIH